jgi:hypothetical protein
MSCGRNSMVVEVKMEEDFDGVIYTRDALFQSEFQFEKSPS